MSRRLMWICLTLALSAAACVLWRERVPEVRSVTLADGSIVRLKQISFGKSHPPVDASLRERVLLRMPTKLVSALGVRTRNVTTPQDTLVLSFEWPTHVNPAPYPQWLRILDTNGLAFGPIAAKSIAPLSNATAMTTFNVPSFPRRQRTLLVELTASDQNLPNGRKHIGNFVIQNLAFTEHEPSRKQGAASAVFDGEQFTLLAIHSGLSATGSLAELHRSNQWSELVFRIGNNEPAQLSSRSEPGDWRIGPIILNDDYGNQFTEAAPLGRIFPLGKQYMNRKDDQIALVRGALWPGEPWHVRAVFWRNFTPSFNPAHTWTTSIPVPPTGATISLQETGQVDGCAILLRSIAADAGRIPLLTLQFKSRGPSYRLGIISAKDQRGNNVSHSISKFGLAPTNSDLTGTFLRTAPEAKEVRITFAVAHPVVVELSGTATILRTNVAYRAYK